MALSGKQAQEWIKPVLYIGGGYLAWKYAISPLLETAGLKDSSEDITRQKIEARPVNQDYWRPGFYKQAASQMPVSGGVQVKLLTSSALDSFARTIYAALNPSGMVSWKSFDGTDEAAIYGVFRQLKYRSQVSHLADFYQKNFTDDLYQALRAELSDSELNTLLQITEKLPWGIVLSSGVVK